MNRIEKLMKALPEGADAALITSDVNRRYFTGLGSTAGTLLAFRDAAYFIIDFRYIEVAKATVTGAKVILQDKLYDQLGELVKKHGARTVTIETDYITVGSLEQYRSRLPQVEFLTAAALNDKILEMRSLKDEEEIAAIRKAQSITDAALRSSISSSPARPKKRLPPTWNTACAVWARMALPLRPLPPAVPIPPSPTLSPATVPCGRATSSLWITAPTGAATAPI